MDTQDTQDAAETSLDERLGALPRQLAGMRLVLEVPKRSIERDEIMEGAGSVGDRPQLAPRVLAAALMLCWPSVHRRQGVPRYAGDLIAYGGEVYDFLLGHGADRLDILRAGGAAVALCGQAFVAQQEAQARARGNSAALGGQSSESGSRSSATGGLLQVASTASIPTSRD